VQFLTTFFEFKNIKNILVLNEWQEVPESNNRNYAASSMRVQRCLLKTSQPIQRRDKLG